jgi:hypothetical protein
MSNLIHLNQLRQDLLNDFVNTRISSATGTLFSTVTGQQVTTGQFDRIFVHLTGNETISGQKAFDRRPTLSGTGFLLSGEPLSVNQTGLLASSGNLGATGANLQNQINAISGFTGNYTGMFYPLTGNPSGFTQIKVTGSNSLSFGNFTGIGSARVILSGSTILISGDPIGMGLFTTGVTSLGATGSINTGLFTGNIVLSGGGNITVFTGANNTIHISGDTGAYANFLTLGTTAGVISLTTTGTFPSGRVSGSVFVSGADSVRVYTGANNSIVVSGIPIGVRSIGATGTVNTGFFTGDILLSGAGNVTVLTGVSPLLIISGNTSSFVTTGQTGTLASSGNLFATGSNLQNQINRITGSSCLFDSGIQTNITRQTFLFPILFAQPPTVFTQLKYLGNTGTSSPTIGISGITTSGFTGVYNTGFTTTGYALSIWATSGANAWQSTLTSTVSAPTSLTSWWSNNPDRPPDVASNWDDEFTHTGSIPTSPTGKWIWINQNNATAIITGNNLRLRDIGTSDSISALYQPISGTDTTGNSWAITAKLKLNDSSYRATCKAGLFMSGTGSRLIGYGYRTNSTDSSVQTLYTGGYASATSVTESTTTFLLIGKDLYLRILNTGGGATGTGLFFQYSRDGYSYRTVFSGVNSGFINETIGNVGVFIDALNSSSAFIDVDFFRLQTGIFF